MVTRLRIMLVGMAVFLTKKSTLVMELVSDFSFAFVVSIPEVCLYLL